MRPGSVLPVSHIPLKTLERKLQVVGAHPPQARGHLLIRQMRGNGARCEKCAIANVRAWARMCVRTAAAASSPLSAFSWVLATGMVSDRTRCSSPAFNAVELVIGPRGEWHSTSRVDAYPLADGN
eukprot:4936626-Pyramimonas_sp.AAC.1